MIGIFGFIILYNVFKIMLIPENQISLDQLFTALSYCTIPLAPFVLLVGLFRMKAKSMTICSMPFIVWLAYSETRSTVWIIWKMRLQDISFCIFPPLFLFYSFCFYSHFLNKKLVTHSNFSITRTRYWII